METGVEAALPEASTVRRPRERSAVVQLAFSLLTQFRTPAPGTAPPTLRANLPTSANLV